jgi:hypothetical protein
MDPYIFPLLGLALFTTLGYFRGRKKNAWIAGHIGKETEEVLRPHDTEYVNFGGTIGYNLVYKLKGPFREAKGTFTLLPRQSLLYLPISLLVSRHDRYYLQLFATGKLAGEGHIVAKPYFHKAKRNITGIEEMSSAEAFKDNKVYYLFWKEKGMEEKLRGFLERLENPKILLHFCCYAENKNFFFYLNPLVGKTGVFLKSAVPGLKPFYTKGGFAHDPGDED